MVLIPVFGVLDAVTYPRLLAPFLPRVVTIRPAFESFERDFLTKVGSALTLSASIAEGISSP
jgi:hypothetical protein